MCGNIPISFLHRRTPTVKEIDFDKQFALEVDERADKMLHLKQCFLWVRNTQENRK